MFVCILAENNGWDHNQHFLVWYTLLSDKIEQRYFGPLELKPSPFFSVKVEETLQFPSNFLFSDYHCNLLGMINENLGLDIMCLQVCNQFV